MSIKGRRDAILDRFDRYKNLTKAPSNSDILAHCDVRVAFFWPLHKYVPTFPRHVMNHPFFWHMLWHPDISFETLFCSKAARLCVQACFKRTVALLQNTNPQIKTWCGQLSVREASSITEAVAKRVVNPILAPRSSNIASAMQNVTKNAQNGENANLQENEKTTTPKTHRKTTSCNLQCTTDRRLTSCVPRQQGAQREPSHQHGK